MASLVRTIRLVRRGPSWRLLVLALLGIPVIAATVLVAQRARATTDRHRQAEVLVERARADNERLSSLTWEAVAKSFVGGHQVLHVDPEVTRAGMSTYDALSKDLNSLDALQHDADSSTLVGETGTLIASGTQSLGTYVSGNRPAAWAIEEHDFRPAVERLDRDAARAARDYQVAADHASTRADIGYIGSLVLGLVVLAMLVWRFERLRRRAAFEAHIRALEHRSDERLRALVEHSSDVVTVIGDDLRIRWQAASVKSMLGHDAGSLVGRPLTELVHPDDAALLTGFVTASAERTANATLDVRLRHADGGWRDISLVAANRLADPAVAGIVLSMRDVGDRRLLEAQLRQHVFHDSLTGLANRALFEDRLGHALTRIRRDRRRAAILLIDLDDLKRINDSLGHSAGDRLLRSVAERLAKSVRPTDTVGRFGGDEFIVLIDPLDQEADSTIPARRILDALAPDFEVDGRELKITASIGMAVADGHADADELIRNADIAMHAAKERGKDRVEIFEAAMHRRAVDRLELTHELHRAVEKQQFELDYQPIVDLRGGAITAVEALVRWRHPTRGRLTPGDFIALAEETGAIIPLGMWIVHTACAHARAWQREFADRPLAVSVNVSTRQLRDARFPDGVAEVLRSTELEPGSLILEITESLLADDREAAIAQLERLKALGVQIAVDDFGTGYSTLSRLQRFPIDILKVDKSFIDGIDQDDSKIQVIRGIVDLAGSLSLDLVAEGIEEPEQAAQLRGLRIRRGQGFLFAKPLDPEALRQLLESHAAVVAGRVAPAGHPRA